MFGRRLRSMLALVAFAAALARLVHALRGDPTTTFSTHPSVDGGPVADRLARALGPVEPGAAVAPDDGADPPVVPGTLFDPDAEPVPTVATAAPEALDPTGAGDTSEAPPTEDLGPAEPSSAAARWVDPVDGGCPDGYPVKAKLKSGIFHLPGMSAYARTSPDRCYRDAEAAVADGLRPAKR